MPLHADTAAPQDFDFIIGDWRVRHRRLNARLVDCKDWTEFEGQSSTMKILGGFGNVEDNLLHFPEKSVRAAAMRSYCRATGNWSIWWLDGERPMQLDTPVVGRFEHHVGLFFADDMLNGQAVKIRFIWYATPGQLPRWEQAFSADGGLHWETNWAMDFFPANGADITAT